MARPAVTGPGWLLLSGSLQPDEDSGHYPYRVGDKVEAGLLALHSYCSTPPMGVKAGEAVIGFRLSGTEKTEAIRSAFFGLFSYPDNR